MCNNGLKLTNFPMFGRTQGWGGPYGSPKIKKNYFVCFFVQPYTHIFRRKKYFQHQVHKNRFPNPVFEKKSLHSLGSDVRLHNFMPYIYICHRQVCNKDMRDFPVENLHLKRVMIEGENWQYLQQTEIGNQDGKMVDKNISNVCRIYNVQ